MSEDLCERGMDEKNKNIVVCICQQSEQMSGRSHINRTLELLQRQWMNEESRIQIAFVYGSGVTCVRDFSDMKEQGICYVENCKESVKLSHLWFMGMALLERKQAQDQREKIYAQNFIYLITDCEFNRIETEKVLACIRFTELKVIPVLIKNKDGAGGSLESYIRRKGNVYLDTEICDIEVIEESRME